MDNGSKDGFPDVANTIKESAAKFASPGEWLAARPTKALCPDTNNEH